MIAMPGAASRKKEEEVLQHNTRQAESSQLRGNPGLIINQGGAHVPYVTVDTKILQHKGWHTAVSKNAGFKSQITGAQVSKREKSF